MAAKEIKISELMHMAGKFYDGILTDMDGTILDSMGMWTEIDRRFLEKRGIVMDDEYTDRLKTMTFPDAADFTISRYGLKESPEDIMHEWDEMCIEMYKTEIDLKRGVREALVEWKKMEIPVAIVSLSKEFMVRTAVKMYGIEPLLTDLVYMESTNKGKDVPDSFFYGADLLGVKPERCLVLEDSLTAMRTAKAAGFIVCAVEDDSAKADREAIYQVADYYMKSFQ